MDVNEFLNKTVKPEMKCDEKVKEALASKGNSGRRKIADGGRVEEPETVDGRIEDLNKGMDDGGGDIMVGNSINSLTGNDAYM